MKTPLCVVFVLFAFSCILMERARSSAAELQLPEKELEEITVWGYYEPENPNRLDKFKQEVIRQGRLKPWETFEEKYEHLLDSLNENFYYTLMRYCYNRSASKERVFKAQFKIRLYDKEEQPLMEDYLRLQENGAKEDSFSVVAYLPYHKNGYEIRIVRLEGEEEVIFDKFAFLTHSELMQISVPRLPYGNINWTFDKESQCFVAPPIK